MTLFRKLLLLVAIPLLFEVIFVSFLLQQNENLAAEKAKVLHAKQVIAAVYRVSDAFLDAAGTLSSFEQSGDTSRLGQFDRAVDAIPALRREARALVANNESQSKRLQELEEMSDFALDELVAIRQALSKFPLSFLTLSEINRRREKLTPLMGQFSERMQQFLQDENLVQDEYEEKETQARQQTRNILLGGLAANLLLAVALTIWLNRHILSRLSLVIENARRIGAQNTLLPPVGGADEIAHLDGVMHDVSQALTEARDRERELEAMKEEFYAMVTHDLRSPMTSVIGAITMVADGALGPVSDKARDMLVIAERNGDRMIALINDLLDWKKMESGKFELSVAQTELSAVCNSALESVSMQANKKKIKLHVECPTLLCEIDGRRVGQVVINLVANAIKFSPAEGEVEVKVSLDDADFEVTVSDRGPGISDNEKSAVFEQFKQTQTGMKHAGSGLGLPICKMIVEQHGGTIGVRDREGGGTTFWFRIPLQPNQVRYPAAQIDSQVL